MKHEKSLYIELIKKTLIQHSNINKMEAHPLNTVNPNWKTCLLYPLDKILRKRNFGIFKLKFVDQYKRLNGEDWPALAYTMIGMTRLNNLEYCIKEVLNNNVPGDFIETGVWRGGSTILMRALLKESGVKDRNVWLVDSFEGLPKPNDKVYKEDKGNLLFTHKILSVSEEEVKQNFKDFDLLDDQVIFLKGWFKDTLPNITIKEIAVLRLDGDLYESTILALTHLYPKLSVGGYVIIDDYNVFANCRQAVETFREQNNITEEIIKIDNEAIFWKKEK